ncbi:MAG: hypothetical protein OEZ32_11235 [Nitrospinota bacterium]|nr:hypothetical protein [Nitrospinota bacterium]
MSHKPYPAYKPSDIEWLGEMHADLRRIEKEIAAMLEEVTE